MTDKEKQNTERRREPVWKETPQNRAPRPDNSEFGFQIANDGMPQPLRKNRK